MRKKTVQYEGGAEFIISPLSLAQYEVLIVDKRKDGKSNKEFVEDTKEVIATSLNNAGADPAWNVDRVNQEIDLALLFFLQADIYEFSGLTEKKAKSPGEQLATT